MEHSFWHQCWDKNQIGFHLPAPHQFLQQHWHQLNAKRESRVLVPLCGKSLDLSWLASQGHQVIGVELSEVAVSSFFQEQQLTPQIEELDGFKRYSCDAITVYCGDFFALSKEHTGELQHFYDRAAVGALPESMRHDYVSQLKGLMAPAATGLCICNDFNQAEMPGPPFSVPPAVIAELYGEDCTLTSLTSMDVLEKMALLRERGLSSFIEHALLIQL